VSEGITNFTIFDGGYRVISGGELRETRRCVECRTGRCDCVLEACASAKKLARHANTVVEGLAGDSWLPLKSYTSLKGGAGGR
jgi:hypothetical protein